MNRAFSRGFRQSVDLRAESAIQIYNNAVAAQRRGRWEDALQGYRKALKMKPDFAPAMHNLGRILSDRGQFEEAIALYEKAAAITPKDADIQNSLGIVYKAMHRFHDALKCFRTAADLNPEFVGAYNNLGTTLDSIDKHEEALICYRKALSIDPKYPDCYNNIGVALKKLSRLTEAMQAYEKAIEYRPDYAEAYNNLGGIYKEQGRCEEALQMLRKSVASKPENAEMLSNICFTSHCFPGFTPEMIFAEHKTWGERHAPLAMAAKTHTNVPDPNRRMRVGYISPDIRDHSCVFFMEPLIASHNPNEVETFAYAEVPKPDAKTEAMKKLFHNWRSTVGMSHDAVAEMIRRDQIDILIECAGHTSSNRLLTLARKPAPIQVTYLGYPDTTGMQAVDYRITDAVADPEGAEKYHTEELVRLPGGFLCFKVHDDAPAVVPLPAKLKGHVTFGSFNIVHKLNRDVIELWSRILLAVPGSKISLKANGFADKFTRERYLAMFSEFGVSADRINVLSWEQARFNHLGLYGDIDISLDPFPYNGTTTTCEGLWMGVPVVTLNGNIHASRVGASLLTRVGLEEFICQSKDEYAQKAVALATDLGKLEQIRMTLRGKMAQSTLCDSKAFARSVEEKFRWMFQRWCQKQKDAGAIVPETPATAVVNAPAPSSSSYMRELAGLVNIFGGDKPAATVAAPVAPAPTSPITTTSTKTEAPTAATTTTPPAATTAHQPLVIGRVAELALLADSMARFGHNSAAAQYASQGLATLRRGQYTGGVPAALLASCNAPTLEGVFLRQCIEFSARSSYFARDQYKDWVISWAKLEPTNPEPFLRFGLLTALFALQRGVQISRTTLETLEHARRIQADVRPTLALQLCKNEVATLEFPYFGSVLHLSKELSNLSTYVMLEQGDWCEPELDLFRSIVRPGDRVLDLGAAVGVYACGAAPFAGESGRVLAVEPDKRNLELLRKSAAQHPTVQICDAAVSDRAGIGRLKAGDTPELSVVVDGESEGTPMRLKTVDQLLSEAGLQSVELLKLDVGNHALKVIAGAERLLTDGAPVIFYDARENKTLRTDLIAKLKELGYESFAYSPLRRCLERYTEKSEIDTQTQNLIAMKPAAFERFAGVAIA